jgi:hypothetical protein
VAIFGTSPAWTTALPSTASRKATGAARRRFIVSLPKCDAALVDERGNNKAVLRFPGALLTSPWCEIKEAAPLAAPPPCLLTLAAHLVARVAVHNCETPQCSFMRLPGAAQAAPL